MGFFPDQDHKCVKEIKDVLLKQCKEKDVLDNLRSFLGVQAQNVGLLVSQRVVNLPPQLLPPLYDALFDEVSWATEDEVRLENCVRWVSLTDNFFLCILVVTLLSLESLFIILPFLKPTAELRKSFCFKYYLLVTRIYEVLG